MPNAIMYISFNLVKGASVPDFLRVSEALNQAHMCKQKGFISWKQLVEGVNTFATEAGKRIRRARFGLGLEGRAP